MQLITHDDDIEDWIPGKNIGIYTEPSFASIKTMVGRDLELFIKSFNGNSKYVLIRIIFK